MKKESTINGVTEVCQRIYDRDGSIKASVLVEESRPKTSPSHPAFEWRNSVAAEEYRLIQARQMIRVVKIEVEDREEKMVHVSASRNDDGDREGVYKPISVVVDSPDEFELALSEALNRLGSARRAVEELEEQARKIEPADGRAAMIAQIAESLSLLHAALNKAVH